MSNKDLFLKVQEILKIFRSELRRVQGDALSEGEGMTQERLGDHVGSLDSIYEEIITGKSYFDVTVSSEVGDITPEERLSRANNFKDTCIIRMTSPELREDPAYGAYLGYTLEIALLKWFIAKEQNKNKETDDGT